MPSIEQKFHSSFFEIALHQGPDCEVRICTVSPARFFTVPDLLCRGRCPLVIFAYDGRFIDRKETRQTFPRDDEHVSHSGRKVENRERSQHISPIPHHDPDDYRLPKFENPRTRPIFRRFIEVFPRS
ncbi:uncharacterized protein LOC116185980 [Apis dorsata]|uniref:uncharacterized protein LOC116185980 n=1 Tax=Apis dorsata TaxID=7462 RepID=UPI001293D73B|nr:uncharacterized protein LOC116185980 [Apis dorsata]